MHPQMVARYVAYFPKAARDLLTNLILEKGYDVVCFLADVGQEEDFEVCFGVEPPEESTV